MTTLDFIDIYIQLGITNKNAIKNIIDYISMKSSSIDLSKYKKVSENNINNDTAKLILKTILESPKEENEKYIRAAEVISIITGDKIEIENYDTLIENENVKNIVISLFKKKEEGKEDDNIPTLNDLDDIKYFIEENYNPKLDKFSKHISDETLSKVKIKNSGRYINAKTVRYIVTNYLSLKNIERLKIADNILEFLDIQSFNDTLENIYQHWLNLGAYIKDKNTVMLYSIYANTEQLIKLKSQIEIWQKNSRMTLAAFILKSLSLNRDKSALIIIDHIANMFTASLIKSTAEEIIYEKASNVGKEEFEDSIIPDLGYSNIRKKEIHYGKRSFNLKLLPSSEIIVENKKSLPTYGKDDDEALVKKAKKTFANDKKIVKYITDIEKKRLKISLISFRKWSIEKWKETFIKNPVMNMFAITLIWGVYDENDRLLESFRYTEDNIFVKSNFDQFKIHNENKIALVYESDLKEEELNEWKEQLKNMNVVQIIEQFNFKDIEKYKIEYLKGKKTGIYSFKSLINELYLPTNDETTYIFESVYIDYAIKIEFNKDFVIENITFYKISDKDKTPIAQNEIPPRFSNGVLSVVESYILDR